MKLRHLTPSDKHFFDQLFAHDVAENRFIAYYKDLEGWLKLVDNKHRHALLATISDRPVGFADVSVELDDTHGASFAFGLAPEYRGRGLGKKLLDSIEEFSREKGAATLYAGVEEDNTACITLLEANGYSQTGLDGNVVSYIKTL